MMRRSFGLFAISMFVMLMAASAKAQPSEPNRILNPDFDVDTTFWTPMIGTRDWDPDDAFGGTGSLRHTAPVDAGSTTGTATGQCVAVTPGWMVGFGASVKIPSGQTRSPLGMVDIRFHAPAETCFTGAGLVPDTITPAQSAVGTWTFVDALARVPVGADKVTVMLLVAPGTGTGAASVLFDGVFLVRNGFVLKSDFNNDLKSDLLWRNYATGQNAIWRMNGFAFIGTSDLPALPNTSYRMEGSADFNEDGKPDIVWRNQTTGQNALWLMNGTTITSIVDLPALPNTNFHFEAIGDFNVDGRPDIVLRNIATGQNAIWLMNGTSLMSIVDLPTLANTNYHLEGSNDFNGDYKWDLVWRNYATGHNAIWLLNGTAVSSIVDLPALTNLNYHIDAVVPLDNNAWPDIVWRNYATGQNAVWSMIQSSVEGIHDLPALANVNYQMGGPQ